MKKGSKANPVNTGPSSLEEVEEICRKPVDVPIRVRGKEVKFPIRLLTPAENERLNRILREVTPPIQKQENAETGKTETVHNMSDPEYLRAMERLLKITRSLALTWCCPWFTQAVQNQAGKEFDVMDVSTGEIKRVVMNPQNRDHVADFVGTKLTTEIQAQLYALALSGEEGEDDRVGF